MINDIFSTFDPYVYSSVLPTLTPLLLVSTFIIVILNLSLWPSINRATVKLLPIFSTIFSQLSRTYSTHIKGISALVSTIFITIILSNLLGITPYSLRNTRHLIITLSIGLPIWILIILSRLTKHPKKTIAHFLPDGAPTWLNPFLVLTETIRVFVQPITLSFRLAANITAGHIVLSLIANYAAATITTLTSINLYILLALIIGYIAFELAICLIQAYIFCLLLSLYSDNHAH